MSAGLAVTSPALQWYRIGDGYLGVTSADAPFRERLQSLFRECAVEGPAQASLPSVQCTVRRGEDPTSAVVEFDDPEPLDLLTFILAIFPDRGYREGLPANGWQVLEMPTPAGYERLVIQESRMLVHRRVPWQALAGNVALNRLLRLQRGVMYLHASAVRIGDRGVLIVGGKGAGKTTLGLALAAHGHTLLGDEMTGVRASTRKLVPVRRSVTVRDGPKAARVEALLDALGAPYEPFPDGTRRRRAYAAELFPGHDAAAPVTLSDLVFLEGFAPAPRLKALRPGRSDLAKLTPLAATLWGRRPADAVVPLLELMTGARCWTLHAGDPDRTAEAVAATLED